MGRATRALASRRTADHISRVPTILPPYALLAPVFRFKHLATLAGRAPIGGAREVALACFVAARLAAECGLGSDDDVESRANRSAGAKAWLGTLALPAGVRTPAALCVERSAAGARLALSREISSLAQAAAAYLDVPSRAELDVLAASLAG